MSPTVAHMVMSALTESEKTRLKKLLELCAVNSTTPALNENIFQTNLTKLFTDDPLVLSTSVKNITYFKTGVKVMIFN